MLFTSTRSRLILRIHFLIHLIWAEMFYTFTLGELHLWILPAEKNHDISKNVTFSRRYNGTKKNIRKIMRPVAVSIWREWKLPRSSGCWEISLAYQIETKWFAIDLVRLRISDGVWLFLVRSFIARWMRASDRQLDFFHANLYIGP